MIRKILLFIAIIYSIVWFIIAYTIQGNIINSIKNLETDNIKISYNQIKFFGFPKHLRIRLVNPKVKFINHVNSKLISAEQITFLFDFSFKKVSLILEKAINQQKSFDSKSIGYSIHSEKDITALIKFNKPVYRLSHGDNIKSIIKCIQINNKLLSIIQESKEVFNIADLFFLINKIKSKDGDNIALQLRLLYFCPTKILKFYNSTP